MTDTEIKNKVVKKATLEMKGGTLELEDVSVEEIKDIRGFFPLGL